MDERPRVRRQLARKRTLISREPDVMQLVEDAVAAEIAELCDVYSGKLYLYHVFIPGFLLFANVRLRCYWLLPSH